MTNYNWIQLEREYLTGKYKSYTEFSEKNNVEYREVSKRGKKWDEKLQRIQDNIVDILSKESAKKILKKHVEVGDKLIDKGLKALEKAHIKGAGGAAVIKIGAEMQYKALGLDDNQKSNVNISISINGNLREQEKAIEVEAKEIIDTVEIEEKTDE